MLKDTIKDSHISLWLFSGGLMIFLMILIGGVTRLTGSGLSIVEWNVIAGTLPPLNDEQWRIAFEKYKQFPQFKKINYSLDLYGFKKIFFWEYIHRLWGRVIGLVFILPFLLFYFQGKIKGVLKNRLIFIFILGGLQGAMGWFMVKSGLADNPNVSHYRLTIHLVLALILLTIVSITALQTSPYFNCGKNKVVNSKSGLRILGTFAFIQIIYGGFVAGLKAGFFYNTFPKMNNTWMPDGILRLEPFYLNAIENGITIQFIHRWLGVILFFIVFPLWIHNRYHGKEGNYLNILLMFMLLQVSLGVLTLLLHVPVFIAVMHQGVGVMVFLLIMILNWNQEIFERNKIKLS